MKNYYSPSKKQVHLELNKLKKKFTSLSQKKIKIRDEDEQKPHFSSHTQKKKRISVIKKKTLKYIVYFIITWHKINKCFFKYIRKIIIKNYLKYFNRDIQTKNLMLEKYNQKSQCIK